MEKLLNLTAAKQAVLQAENNHLEEDFCAVQPHTRKRVRDPPKDRFARADDIIKAEEASYKPPKRRRGARRQDPGPVVEAARDELIHGLERFHQAQEI